MMGGEAAAEPDASAPETVRRFVWQLQQLQELPLRASPHLAGKHLAVIGGGESLAASVSAELRRQGAVVYESGDPLFAGLDGIIDLGLAADVALDEHGRWQEAFERSLNAIRVVYDSWAEETNAQRIFYVAMTYFGGGMGYRNLGNQARVFGGIWAGFAKTLHQELPNCNAKVIDIDPTDVEALPGILTRELYRWGVIEVGYQRGIRYTLAADRHEVAEPSLALTSQDLVLISGGSRGIGFALARLLAEESGCRVVITGRHSLPQADEPWLEADEESFQRHQREWWNKRHTGLSLAEIRATMARNQQRRDLSIRLQQAHAAGLRIDYEVCDFTDQRQVSALVESLGSQLSGVVHNAGIDLATRLPNSSNQEVLETLRTKVEGFTNLFTASGGRALKFFCNVGSVGGRFGGMVGQIAYAAANDGLTRLGLWADQRSSFPLMTLCWTTWQRLGMIANYDGALRYMSPVAIHEGVQRWQRELLAPSTGEVTFVGALGRALDPGQARAYQFHPEVLEIQESYPRIFHLGLPLHRKPTWELVADIDWEAASSPALSDFTLGGAPAVPVSVLLENAVASAQWVHPIGEELRLSAITEFSVRADQLKLVSGRWQIRRSSIRSKVDGHWVVDVRFERAVEGGTVPVAEMRLVYDSEHEDFAAPMARRDQQEQRVGALDRAWSGVVFPPAQWQSDSVGDVREPQGEDLWTVALVPRLLLPVAALENVVRASSGPRWDSLQVHSGPTARSRIELDSDDSCWRISDPATGKPVVTVRLASQ